MNDLIVNLFYPIPMLGQIQKPMDKTKEDRIRQEKKGYDRKLTIIRDMVNISHFRTSNDTSRLSLAGSLERDPAMKIEERVSE